MSLFLWSKWVGSTKPVACKEEVTWEGPGAFPTGYVHGATCLLWDSLWEQKEKPKAVGVTQCTALGHQAALPGMAEQS